MDAKSSKIVAEKIKGGTIHFKAFSKTQKDATQDYEAEKEALCCLRTSDCIVRFYGFSEIEEYSVIALENYSNGSLDRFLSGRSYTEATVQTILAQTTNALAFCVENGVVHRDVKLGNLLVKEVEPLRILLADFAYSQTFESKEAAESALMTESVGTLQYKAPEVFFTRSTDATLKEELSYDEPVSKEVLDALATSIIKPEENLPYTYKCDIWSLGVLAFHLAVGREYFPFEIISDDMKILRNHFAFDEGPRTEQELRKQHVIEHRIKNQEIQLSIDEIPTVVSDNLKDLISKLLKRDPTKRPHYLEITGHPFLAQDLNHRGLPSLCQ